MEIKKIDERLKEIPTILENLKAEYNQVLGYKQALKEIEESKSKKGNKK